MAELLDGRYLLHETLGRGAFGTVHRAEHRVLGHTLRQVAVKLFDADPAVPAAELLGEALQLIRVVDESPDPVIRDRFLACYDAGVDGGTGRPYMVTELARGDLARRLHGGQLPASTVRDHALQLCQGLAFLHERGVVHLDLKPGNVLVSASGSLKIGDFGLARRVSTLLRRAPTAGGTVWYLPAEVLQLREAGPEADVYALGLTCYEMLTGRLPGQDQLRAAAPGDGGRADIDTLVRLKLRDVEPPGTRNPELRGHPLEAVVMRALSPLATDRYPDAGAFLRALDETAPAASPARAPTPRQRAEELVAHIRAAMRRGDLGLAHELRCEALDLNRALPDTAMVAEVYLLATELALLRKDPGEARAMATEGLGRRRCRVTYQAMATAFAGTELGRGFARRSREETSR
ncbi:serine/threonine-protein kinase [Streptomyces sp. TRM68367]|uniref:serine/threonine-protein kinase n=1 Tax=Streptomyces sp. TRM68367 TaxID=2758415 RepID=UPI00165AC486|nr:serine/threonine-protein kinase [Streptomyces sp. TRM68367]MBC9727902.1 serine/threonine protein kinase [Streptomyces sp. TRM68367]